MTDFPRIAPPADGLALAMGAARSRRLRKASASSGASALAVVMVAVLAGTSGRSTLTEQPTPEQPAVIVQVVPDGQERSVDQGAKPNVVSPLTGSAARPGGVAALGQPTGLSSSAPFLPSDKDTTRTGNGSSLPTVPYTAGPIKRTDNGLALPTCQVSSDGQSPTVCPTASESTSGQKAGSHEFYTDVCNSEAQPYTLHFGSSNEVDFTILKAGKELWRWSSWHAPGPDAHTAVVGTGACITWTFVWTSVDRQGVKLPPGDYTLRTRNLATEMSGRSIADVTVTVT